MSNLPGILYVVSLPIGNASDITTRAREVLSGVNIIAAEDTRKAREWFQRTGIRTEARILASHSHNENNSAKGLLPLLHNGENIALVSDAGTPRISDPGYTLVKTAHAEGIVVIPIPGACALTTLVSVSPLPVEPLLFLGFISPKSGTRLNTLARYNDFEGSVVLYESVHRIEKLLAALKTSWGNCEVFIGREMTKTHEEYFFGNLETALSWVPGKKGEFAICVFKKRLM